MMISYGQNFEDVILSRVLQDVKNGFYIDVGAHDPVVDSVTQHFYSIGWSGLNIEPQLEFFKKLNQMRPRDRNLNICAGNFDGEIQFATVTNRTGWSTSSVNHIQNLKNDNELTLKIENITQLTLSTIIKQESIREIHFLKVDVEGLEYEVLEGIDLRIYRPWVVVVESTLPGTQIASFEKWENFLLENNYQFTYADGLNRFYLAEEHKELAERFQNPPNLFDNFISLQTHNLMLERDSLIAQIEINQRQINELNLKNMQLVEVIDENRATLKSQDNEIQWLIEDRQVYRSQIEMLRGSWSWRITSPLRQIAEKLGYFRT